MLSLTIDSTTKIGLSDPLYISAFEYTTDPRRKFFTLDINNALHFDSAGEAVNFLGDIAHELPFAMAVIFKDYQDDEDH